jgi:hypothetical protein
MLGHRGSIRASKVTPTRRTLGQGKSCDELLAPSNPARTTSEELIIREARQRHRRRLLAIAGLVVVVVASGVSAFALVSHGSPTGTSASTHSGDASPPTVGVQPKSATVPNVVGTPATEAALELSRSGFKLTNSPGAGTVTSQIPHAGSQVPPSSGISLQVIHLQGSG